MPNATLTTQPKLFIIQKIYIRIFFFPQIINMSKPSWGKKKLLLLFFEKLKINLLEKWRIETCIKQDVGWGQVWF